MLTVVSEPYLEPHRAAPPPICVQLRVRSARRCRLVCPLLPATVGPRMSAAPPAAHRPTPVPAQTAPSVIRRVVLSAADLPATPVCRVVSRRHCPPSSPSHPAALCFAKLVPCSAKLCPTRAIRFKCFLFLCIFTKKNKKDQMTQLMGEILTSGQAFVQVMGKDRLSHVRCAGKAITLKKNGMDLWKGLAHRVPTKIFSSRTKLKPRKFAEQAEENRQLKKSLQEDTQQQQTQMMQAFPVIASVKGISSRE